MPAHDPLLFGLGQRPDADVGLVRGRVQEPDAARPVVQDVDLPAEQLRIGVGKHPLDPVHGVELRVGGIGEEAVVVLLGVVEVLDTAVPQDLADAVDVRRPVGEAVRDRTRDRVDRVAEGAKARQVPREAHRLHPEGLQEAEQIFTGCRR